MQINKRDTNGDMLYGGCRLGPYGEVIGSRQVTAVSACRLRQHLSSYRRIVIHCEKKRKLGKNCVFSVCSIPIEVLLLVLLQDGVQ